MVDRLECPAELIPRHEFRHRRELWPGVRRGAHDDQHGDRDRPPVARAHSDTCRPRANRHERHWNNLKATVVDGQRKDPRGKQRVTQRPGPCRPIHEEHQQRQIEYRENRLVSDRQVHCHRAAQRED